MHCILYMFKGYFSNDNYLVHLPCKLNTLNKNFQVSLQRSRMIEGEQYDNKR